MWRAVSGIVGTPRLQSRGEGPSTSKNTLSSADRCLCLSLWLAGAVLKTAPVQQPLPLVVQLECVP